MRDTLYTLFADKLMLPQPAVSWLLDVWDVIQTLDDYADGEPVSRERLDQLIWLTLVQMPHSSFARAHMDSLAPMLATSVLKWQASDAAEREGAADARSFMWRAGYYDLVLLVYSLCHGPDAARRGGARLILSMYGESLDDYLQEFSYA